MFPYKSAHPLEKPMHLLKRARAALASDTGTFNLSSNIVGAPLVTALIGGLVVGLARTLPCRHHVG